MVKKPPQTPEQVIGKPREAEVKLDKGKSNLTPMRSNETLAPGTPRPDPQSPAPSTRGWPPL